MTQKLHEAMDAVAKLVESHGIDQRGGKKYVQVVHRVEALRRAYDVLARIETQILVDDGERVLMMATVSLGENVVGTGHAEEIRGEGYVNKTSAIENCETSAIGRALAACGLAGGEYASVNELDGVQRKEKAQASKAEPQSDATPSKHPPPSEKEMRAQKFAEILAWLESGKATEKQIAGMIARSAELVQDGALSQRDQRKLHTEFLIHLSEWDQAQEHLVRMQSNSYLTKKQVDEYMVRVDAGRGDNA